MVGDTHNAWANNLAQDSEVVAVEFTTASVTSPGIEAFFGLNSAEKIASTEAAMLQFIKGVKYTNLAGRGFWTVPFTPDKAVAKWAFVSSVKARGNMKSFSDHLVDRS